MNWFRKWTQEHPNKGGRPRIDQELEALIVCLAEENPRWGYDKIEGELIKLGVRLSQTTIRNVLNRNGIVPPLFALALLVGGNS